jgi:uncharacterized membrane protein (DUF4010 family)
VRQGWRSGSWRRGARHAAVPPFELRNLLDLPLALKFGLLVAVVMALSRWLAMNFGQAGLLAGAAAAGLADIDAITVSLGRLIVDNVVGSHQAAAGVVLAAARQMSEWRGDRTAATAAAALPTVRSGTTAP